MTVSSKDLPCAIQLRNKLIVSSSQSNNKGTTHEKTIIQKHRDGRENTCHDRTFRAKRGTRFIISEVRLAVGFHDRDFGDLLDDPKVGRVDRQRDKQKCESNTPQRPARGLSYENNDRPQVKEGTNALSVREIDCIRS
jgi:hypothetical protein